MSRSDLGDREATTVRDVGSRRGPVIAELLLHRLRVPGETLCHLARARWAEGPLCVDVEARAADAAEGGKRRGVDGEMGLAGAGGTSKLGRLADGEAAAKETVDGLAEGDDGASPLVQGVLRVGKFPTPPAWPLMPHT